MKIIADENIPFVKQSFTSLGKVKTLPGRLISHTDLIDAEILLVRSITQVNAELLNNTAIKFVASATSGINHIDTEYLKQNNIAFAHALGSNAISVAQYVVVGICYWSLQNNKPLEQLSIGIIGYGNVGTQLEILCNKLGISCILNDPPLAENGHIGLQEINTALACDIVSLHVPLTQSGKHTTKYLINADNINQLKPDGLFINAARGGVVDERALLSYKAQHPNFSIVLDTWENEPNINSKMLAQTIISTPHIAGYSFDGKIRGTDMIYQACCEFLKQTPQWSANGINLKENPPYNFKYSIHKDIREQILEAYNILNDDKPLRLTLSQSELNTGQYFDNLRKNYPIRREWSSNF